MSKTDTNIDRKLRVTISDDNKLNVREGIDGYYQCFAENDQGGGFKSLSPVIRLIYAAVEGTPAKGEVEVQKGTGVKLPCIGEDVRISSDEVFSYGESGVQFLWEIRDYRPNAMAYRPVNFDSAANVNRLRLDRRTGDLYIVSVRDGDDLKEESVDGSRAFYQCSIIPVQDANRITVNKIGLNIKAVPASTLRSFVLYPVEDSDKTVTCQEGYQCRVPCLFGGEDAVKGDEARKFRGPPGSEDIEIAATAYGFSFTPTIEADGLWKCLLVNPLDSTEKESVDITVRVLRYPELVSKEDFKDQILPVGDKVTYDCAVNPGINIKPIEFYVNGEKVENGNPSHVQIDRSRISMDNIQREYSSNIACMVTSEAGSVLVSANLDVYDRPVATNYPDTHQIQDKDNRTEISYNCSFTLDQKTEAGSVGLAWWKTKIGKNETAEKIVTKSSADGIKDLDTNIPSSTTERRAESTIVLEIDSQSLPKITDTEWQCVVNYRLLGKDLRYESQKMQLTTPETKPRVEVPPPFCCTWLIVGAALGLVFLILLVVLIHFYIKKNKGERYYVDEHERKAGHNPDEELQDYAFHEYKRPDQNPIKGSRASMNFSDKPMESDNGSMDEYGDIDTGRFNEDGSFIGQYGQKQPPRNQADV